MRSPAFYMKLPQRTQLYHFRFGRSSAADYIQSPVVFILERGQ
jgi:hypothetical protein